MWTLRLGVQVTMGNFCHPGNQTQAQPDLNVGSLGSQPTTSFIPWRKLAVVACTRSSTASLHCSGWSVNTKHQCKSHSLHETPGAPVSLQAYHANWHIADIACQSLKDRPKCIHKHAYEPEVDNSMSSLHTICQRWLIWYCMAHETHVSHLVSSTIHVPITRPLFPIVKKS
jgi:hypothetical protein